MLRVKNSGSFDHFRSFADRVLKRDIYADLDEWGQIGVDALSDATPKRTGKTAASWSYKIIKGHKPGIAWYNDNEDAGGTPIVILIQYGHGTGTGGYVQGRDFINPAIMPVFDKIAEDIWKEVTKP